MTYESCTVSGASARGSVTPVRHRPSSWFKIRCGAFDSLSAGIWRRMSCRSAAFRSSIQHLNCSLFPLCDPSKSIRISSASAVRKSTRQRTAPLCQDPWVQEILRTVSRDEPQRGRRGSCFRRPRRFVGNAERHDDPENRWRFGAVTKLRFRNCSDRCHSASACRVTRETEFTHHARPGIHHPEVSGKGSCAPLPRNQDELFELTALSILGLYCLQCRRHKDAPCPQCL